MGYDAVVVGAGPAGSMTAKTLAAGGSEVLLVEKRPEIGVPVRCGEATGIAGLNELGVEANKWFVANSTRGAHIYAPDKTRVELVTEEPINYILERCLFDKHLALQAAKAGAEVKVNTAVKGLIIKDGAVKGVVLEQDDRYEVECGCVVGADGIEGMVGRWAGLNTRTRLREMTSDVQFELAGVELEQEDIMDFYFSRELAPGGYAWVFPKGRGVANVGLGVRGAPETALEYLRKFIDSMRPLRNAKVIGIVAGGVPLQGPLERTVGNGVLLVGDAARQVDPLTGGGIYNAMHCGVIAGKTILKAIAKKDFGEAVLMDYEREWRSSIGTTLLQSLQIRRMHENFSDEEINAAAKLMKEMIRGEFGINGDTQLMRGMPSDILHFIHTLLLKN